MAYDRYDTRRDQERGRYSDFDRDRDRDRWRGREDERGFFERAGDEISSWFGDEEAERRRREDERMGRGWGWGRDRDFDRDRPAFRATGREFEDRGSSRPINRTSSNRDYPSAYGGYDRDFGPRARNFDRDSRIGYAGGYGYTGGSSGYGSGTDRGYGSGGFGGGFGDRDTDRHHHAWRQRQLDELDRDYDEYRRENRERFESDFGTWRQNRQQKRGLLGNIREHMDVVGSDGEQIGKVDKVRGDHIVLTKADSDDNRHHMIKCTMIDTVEGDQVRLDVPAEEAKSRWKDEDERGFFGRDDEERDVNLERSFAGTYR
jgi:hypothetical protein